MEQTNQAQLGQSPEFKFSDGRSGGRFSLLLKSISALSDFRLGFYVFLGWALWVSLEYYAFGPYSYLRIWDNGDRYLAYLIANARQLAQYGVQNWLPFTVSGVARVDPAISWDTPLFILLPGWAATALVMLIQRFVAGFFTFLVCREHLSLSRGSSLFAGLLYATGTPALAAYSHFELSLLHRLGPASFPMFIWALERLRYASWPRLSVLGPALGIIFALTNSLYLHTIFFIPMMIVWFALFRPIDLKFWVSSLLFCLGIALVSFPQIAASMANASLSHRSVWVSEGPDWARFQTKVRGLLVAYKEIFALIVFSLPLIWSSKNKSWLKIALLVVFSSIVAYTFAPLKFYVRDYLGPLTGVQFDRFYFLAPFFISLWLGVTIEALRRASARSPRAPLWAIYLVCTLLIGYYSVGVKLVHAERLKSYENYAINYEDKLIKDLAISSENAAPFRVASVVAKNWRPDYAAAYGFEIADGYFPVHSRRYHKFWGRVISPLTKKDGKTRDYFENWGSRAYLFVPKEFDTNSPQERPPRPLNFRENYNLSLLSLANVKYIFSPIPVQHADLKLVAARRPDSGFYSESRVARKMKSIVRERELYIYRNRTVLPRYFLVGDYRVFETESDLLQTMKVASRDTFLNQSFLLKSDFSRPQINSSAKRVSGTVSLIQQTPDVIKLQVELESAGMLVAANNYSPFWTATVDGQSEEIIPAYLTFQGIFLQAGKHQIVLKYQP